ncbi:right-handed parallel beta-helix repeat-containing protein [Microbulbifer sp. JMSA008]|uniref:right-handed parallel beta-helix repeat-containing protein n=1 Tax=Microbulbifer sp. JMSA008 TaxID=3243373 RepID=UPI0040399C18
MMTRRLRFAATFLIFQIITSGLLISPYGFAVECYDTITSPTLLSKEINCPLSVDTPQALTIIGPSGSLTMLEGGKVSCTTSTSESGKPKVGVGSMSAGGWAEITEDGEVTFGNWTQEEVPEIQERTTYTVEEKMNLFRVRAGVLIEGSSANITGGEIEGCPTGINVQGLGSHTITGIKILNSEYNGIIIRSSHNKTSNNEITGIIRPRGYGIMIETGSDNNTINSNYISATSGAALHSQGNHTTITKNEIVNNQGHGIVMAPAANNSAVIHNQISFNKYDRVQVHTDLNTLSVNTITHNESRGIIMMNAKDNTIKDNVIIYNKTFDIVDHSQNMLCTNKVNNWANNSIGDTETAMPACLKEQ